MENKNMKSGNATLTILLYSKYFQSFPSELYAISYFVGHWMCVGLPWVAIQVTSVSSFKSTLEINVSQSAQMLEIRTKPQHP